MKIVRYPHPILAYPSKPVKRIDQGFRDIAAEMLDLMYDAEGVGLAANQVGLPYQLLVMNPTGDPTQKEEEYIFVNPVIQKRGGGLKDFQEGCLSFPELHLVISRPDAVTFQAIGLDGQPVTLSWKGIKARIFQHETDHLRGQCFYQRAKLSGELQAKAALEAFAAEYEADRGRGLIPSDSEIAAQIAELEKEHC
ncbi:MAG: peptide deformylase [Thermoguttaceae bacterium]